MAARLTMLLFVLVIALACASTATPAPGATRVPTPDVTVIGKSFEPGYGWCVQLLVKGARGEHCGRDPSCYEAARIGAQAPRACR